MGFRFFNEKKGPPPQEQKPIKEPGVAAAAPPPSAQQQLEARIQKLEAQIDQLTSMRPEIRIDVLHMHQPVLENLTFKMDHIEVKELSGSLNLGNNFGATPNTSKASPEAGKSSEKTAGEAEPIAIGGLRKEKEASGNRDQASSESSSHPQRTEKGYRFTIPIQPKGGV